MTTLSLSLNFRRFIFLWAIKNPGIVTDSRSGEDFSGGCIQMIAKVLLGELEMRKFEETGVENVEWVWHVDPPWLDALTAIRLEHIYFSCQLTKS